MTTINQVLAQNLPERNLSQLSLVNHSKNDMIKWVHALPIMNVGETTKQLYQTLQELTRVKMSEETRYELLEILRPTVHNILHALAKHYLNQAVLLPDRANKVASLAQSLRTYLATAYKVVAYDCSEKLMTKLSIIGIGRRQQLQLAAQAFERAITELNGLLLETQLLYLPAPAGLWSDLHTLHHAASTHGVASIAVADSHLAFCQEITPHEAYLRTIVLASSQTNKLRQTEIRQIFDASEIWAHHLKLKPKFQISDLLLIDIDGDLPPTYVSKAADVPQAHYVDASKFVQHLQAVQTTPNSQLHHGEQLNPSLIQHLIGSWSSPSERTFARRSYDGQLLVCLGLTASHYHIAHEIEFEHFLNLPPDFSEEEKNFFLRNGGANDPHEILDFKISSVASIADEQDVKVPRTKSQSGLYPPYEAMIVNISPGGYCIRWDCEPPMSLRTGEILAMREPSEKSWTIGIIRWVKQLPTKGAEAGIEIISGTVKP
ncbi:MAG TPA: hypothetical protein PLJ88_03225, partial [Agitococcus sp.]|nr:hypothetical protein [Agitococcus sp.]